MNLPTTFVGNAFDRLKTGRLGKLAWWMPSHVFQSKTGLGMANNMTHRMEQLTIKYQVAEKAVTCFLYNMFVQREGRIDRIQFLFAFGILLYSYVLFFDVSTAVLGNYYPDSHVAAIVLFFVLAALFQRPFQALFTKRLHDMNQTGWLFFVGMLLFYCSVPIYQDATAMIAQFKTGTIFNIDALNTTLGKEKAFIIIAFLYNLFLLLVLFMKKGTTGKNIYGQDPLRNVDESKRFSHIVQICKNG